MDRIIPTLLAVGGVLAVAFNRHFGDVAITNSRRIFGVDYRVGSRGYRFMFWFGRTLAIVVGSAMAVLGMLDALRIDWRGRFLHGSSTEANNHDGGAEVAFAVGLAALIGIVTIVASKPIAHGLVASTQQLFGRTLHEESTRFAKAVARTRVFVVLVGVSLLSTGTAFLLIGR